MEKYPTKISVLNSTNSGKVRLMLKWTEFGTMGMIPGTLGSDAIGWWQN
ncbi:MAG: hypothetical protein ACK4ND_09625 [Cytophagaceae bacterium]